MIFSSSFDSDRRLSGFEISYMVEIFRDLWLYASFIGSLSVYYLLDCRTFRFMTGGLGIGALKDRRSISS